MHLYKRRRMVGRKLRKSRGTKNAQMARHRKFLFFKRLRQACNRKKELKTYLT